MAAGFNAGFIALATQLALMCLGVCVLGLTVLGLGIMFSWFDRGIMAHVKDALLRIIAGAALAGGANIAGAFIIANFKL